MRTSEPCAHCNGSGIAPHHPGTCIPCLGSGDEASHRRRAILAANRPPLTPRSCMDCDNIYRGDLDCPACGNHSGEPLNG